jgi:hypothetical protein
MNPFDQFDVNPFDQFDGAPQAPSSAEIPITGDPVKDRQLRAQSRAETQELRSLRGAEDSIGDKLFGAGEAALAVATSIPATLLGAWTGGEEGVKQANEKYAYSPRSYHGQDYADVAGEALTQLAPNLVQMTPHIGAIRRTGKKPVDVSKVDKIEANPFDQFDSTPEGEFWKNRAEDMARNDATVERLEATLEKRNVPQQDPIFIDSQGQRVHDPALLQASEMHRQVEAQKAVEARQAQLELDTARQQKLDFNAAERARQEAAPVPGLVEERANQQRMIQLQEEITQLKEQQAIAEQARVEAEQRGVQDQRAMLAQEEAQRQIEARQTELEFEVAKQHHMDFNAAERQRMGINSGMGRSQRGAIDLDVLGEGLKKIMGLSKNSPEIVAAKGLVEKEKTREIMGRHFGALNKYRPTWNTKEKVISVADEHKDLTTGQKFIAKTVKPGMRRARISYDHPLLHFIGEQTSKVFRQAENLSRQYITGKDGIGNTYKKLSSDERVELHQLLMKGDKEEKYYSPKEMRAAGFNETQIEFIQKIYEMDKAKLDIWNEALLSTGQKPVRDRAGHWAGVFTGDYRSLVLDAEGKVIGYIGVDTRHGLKKVKEQIKEKYGDVTFLENNQGGRKDLGGNTMRSDLLSGMNDLVNVLAENDPRIAEIQQAVNDAIARQANTLYGADKHSLEKKGIWGNEGNKPWQTDQRQAANEAFKAFFRYWEDGIVSHLNMPIEAEVAALMNNTEVAKAWPNAIDYGKKYIRNMTGRSTDRVGMGINAILDVPGRMLGFGQTVPRATINQINKRFGQLTQGFFNVPFTAMQFLQVAQTAFPEFVNTAQRVGVNPIQAELAINNSAKTMMGITAEKMSGKKKDFGEAQPAVDYARDNGLLEFSEFEEVNKITQNKYARTADKIIDFNRELGEQATRPLVFFTFVDILKKGGFPEAEVFDTAYNLTQDSMVDYSARERPLMFKDLGVIGNLAGGLQQYTFSYLDQMARWNKEAVKGNIAPWALGMGAAVSFAGIAGLPFYQEADEIHRAITNRSLSDTVLKNVPDYLKYGPASTTTGINLGNRLGASVGLAERFNHPAEVLSPYASTITRQAGAIGELATERDELSLKNAALAFAPTSARGLLENQLSTRDLTKNEKPLYEEGTRMYQNRKGQSEYPRTEADQEKRNWGVTSLKEAKDREDVFKSSQERAKDQEKMRAITERIGRVMLQRKPDERANWFNSPAGSKAIQDYIDLGGDPKQLLKHGVPNQIVDGMKTAKQRAEGTPKTLQGVKRYEYYNR